MEIITSTDNLSITKDKQLYKIEFKCQSYEIINSLLKTRIVRDGITDESYKTIKFNEMRLISFDVCLGCEF